MVPFSTILNHSRKISSITGKHHKVSFFQHFLLWFSFLCCRCVHSCCSVVSSTGLLIVLRWFTIPVVPGDGSCLWDSVDWLTYFLIWIENHITAQMNRYRYNNHQTLNQMMITAMFFFVFFAFSFHVASVWHCIKSSSVILWPAGDCLKFGVSQFHSFSFWGKT